MIEEQVEDMTNEAVDFFAIQELDVPPSPPQAHRALITSVSATTLNNEKQSTKISINLVSRDVPTVERSLDIWIPKGYLEVIGSPTFDPKTLPADYFGKGDPRNNNQQASFRMGFANKDKNATLQLLVFNPNSIARSAGRDPVEVGVKAVKPGDLDTYVENLNKMLEGVEVIMLLKERGGEPPYNHTMEVKKILSADTDDPKNVKLFKGYQLAWNS
jgi:hypothetical protein